MEETKELTGMNMEEGAYTGSNGTPNETKNEKFIRLAVYRVNKIMSAVSSLDKLHNRNTYEYTDEQVNAVFESLENQLAEVKGHFEKIKVQESKFSFSAKAE
ncbi:hypothetical protein LGK97_18925 [Clostridium sp. CS001]|uniref:hypothetical protein n=1 Tax=Clostridium sp. CS001 TaxID=2880648 RepID=UPI001CF580B6|nr:hypothetical protein [Clostridium sp. CS001]MCB2291789.1 hypothetical protein [Clostridium sp. CS001]